MERKEIYRFLGLTLISIPLWALFLAADALDIHFSAFDLNSDLPSIFFLIYFGAVILLHPLGMAFSRRFRSMVHLKRGLVFFLVAAPVYSILVFFFDWQMEYARSDWFFAVFTIFGPFDQMIFIKALPHAMDDLVPIFLLQLIPIFLLYSTRPQSKIHRSLKDIYIALGWFFGSVFAALLGTGA